MKTANTWKTISFPSLFLSGRRMQDPCDSCQWDIYKMIKIQSWPELCPKRSEVPIASLSKSRAWLRGFISNFPPNCQVLHSSSYPYCKPWITSMKHSDFVHQYINAAPFLWSKGTSYFSYSRVQLPSNTSMPDITEFAAFTNKKDVVKNEMTRPREWRAPNTSTSINQHSTSVLLYSQILLVPS